MKMLPWQKLIRTDFLAEIYILPESLGTLPEFICLKKYFLSVFLRKHPGKMVVIGSGHMGTLPEVKWPKISFFQFFQETSWKNGAHLGDLP
jgi:hypothetical protein